MNKKQKEQEYSYLKKFLELINLSPEQILDNESPDFIIILNGKRIGIEITEYHSDDKGPKGQPRREVEETRKKLLSDLMKEVKKNQALGCVNGVLSFKNLDVPPRKKHYQFIKEILEVSNQNLPDNKNREVIIDRFEKNPLLSQYLKELRLEYHSHGFDWGIRDFAWVGISEQELLKTIERKTNIKYGEKGLSEIWLLIVSGTNLSQAVPPFELLRLDTYSECNKILCTSEFREVYFFIYMQDQILRWDKSTMQWTVCE